MKTITLSLLATALLLSTASVTQADEFAPLGPVHLGATVGIGVPSPVSLQGVFKYKKLIGANLELGMLPEINVSDIRVHQEMIDASVHLYPFSGAFFVGLGIGAQRLTALGATSSQGVSGDAKAVVNTTFLYPRLGFLHRFDFGLALGMDIGVELPVSGSADVSANAGGVSLPVPKGVSDISDKMRTLPIPVVHLLQVGYLF